MKEAIIRKIMGVPDEGELKGNRQITGLGRGPATSNKVFIIEPADGTQADFNSTLAQMAAEKSAIDWSVNCGNMSAAIPMFLLNNGLVTAGGPGQQLPSQACASEVAGYPNAFNGGSPAPLVRDVGDERQLEYSDGFSIRVFGNHQLIVRILGDGLERRQIGGGKRVGQLLALGAERVIGQHPEGT